MAMCRRIFATMVGEAMRDIILSLAVGPAVFYVDDAPIHRGFVVDADIIPTIAAG
jgi:hypothetical protein